MFAPNAAQFSSVDEAQQWALKEILSSGQTVAPRGMETSEILGASFSISNPRRRCITNPTRNWSFPLAIGELCWHLSASDDLSFIAHYAPRWREFSEDGRRVKGSCYGKRIFSQSATSSSQWDRIIRLLTNDPMSRRGVLTFHELPASALIAESKDVSCATVMQF